MMKIGKILLLLLSVGCILVSGGCRGTDYAKEEQYAVSVRQLVDESVKYTRIWKEQDAAFHCDDTAAGKEYLKTLDKLAAVYKKLLMLPSSDSFDEDDKELKESAERILSLTAAVKSHAEYAVQSGDDTLFQKEKTKLFEDYEECYEQLTYASQKIQTFWRNA